MQKFIIILAIVAAASNLRAIDGRSIESFAYGSQYSSHYGTNALSAFVLITSLETTPKIDFETGVLALSPTKAAEIAYRALTEHFKDLNNIHIEEVTLHTYKLKDGQHGFYTVIIEGNERYNPPRFQVPVLLDGQVVIPTTSDDK